jgi:hypothetical protein
VGVRRRGRARRVIDLHGNQRLSTEAVRKLGERFHMAAQSENFRDFSRSARR